MLDIEPLLGFMAETSRFRRAVEAVADGGEPIELGPARLEPARPDGRRLYLVWTDTSWKFLVDAAEAEARAPWGPFWHQLAEITYEAGGEARFGDLCTVRSARPIGRQLLGRTVGNAATLDLLFSPELVWRSPLGPWLAAGGTLDRDHLRLPPLAPEVLRRVLRHPTAARFGSLSVDPSPDPDACEEVVAEGIHATTLYWRGPLTVATATRWVAASPGLRRVHLAGPIDGAVPGLTIHVGNEVLTADGPQVVPSGAVRRASTSPTWSEARELRVLWAVDTDCDDLVAVRPPHLARLDLRDSKVTRRGADVAASLGVAVLLGGTLTSADAHGLPRHVDPRPLRPRHPAVDLDVAPNDLKARSPEDRDTMGARLWEGLGSALAQWFATDPAASVVLGPPTRSGFDQLVRQVDDRWPHATRPETLDVLDRLASVARELVEAESDFPWVRVAELVCFVRHLLTGATDAELAQQLGAILRGARSA